MVLRCLKVILAGSGSSPPVAREEEDEARCLLLPALPREAEITLELTKRREEEEEESSSEEE